MQGPRSAAGDSLVRVPADLAPLIDHTLLKAESAENDIVKLCAEAARYGFKAVCVNPIFVRKTRELLGPESQVLTAAVVGFPLGAHAMRVKALETELAVADGAAEIDMMARIDLIKAGAWREVEADVRTVVRSALAANARCVVKVILETGLLTRQELADACRACEAGGAHFVKTSTGFLSRGASLEDIRIMRESCSLSVKIKASGGIKTFTQALALIEAGATRLGTSSGVFLVSGADAPATGY